MLFHNLQKTETIQSFKKRRLKKYLPKKLDKACLKVIYGLWRDESFNIA